MPNEDEVSFRLSFANAATLACVWEVSAPKPGNVHRGADFDDVTYLDFIASAVVAGPIVARAGEIGVGRAVLDAVRATRQIAGSNTNLGTLLLIAPLAAVPDGAALADGVGAVFERLTYNDTRDVYKAIRISSAGGLGRATRADVAEAPPADLKLVEAMRMAANRDLVARQYVNQFADVFDGAARWIEEGLARQWPLATAIVHAQLRQMAAEPDSLILRKCGLLTAQEASDRAASVLEAGNPGDEAFEEALGHFDFWLRTDGHRRNPGTTADLIAAALFVLLREGRVKSWR
jgi:triphosphoribosyl-dephospho-CoA synthase